MEGGSGLESGIRGLVGLVGAVSTIHEVAKLAPKIASHFRSSSSTKESMLLNAKRILSSQVSRAVKATVIIAILRAVEKWLTTVLAPMKFPGALAGMVVLSVVLILLEPVFGANGKKIATDINIFCDAACAFLTKWMPLFFAPALVTLPAAISSLMKSGDKGVISALVKSVIIVVIGFLGTLVSTANVTKMTQSRSTASVAKSTSDAFQNANGAPANGNQTQSPASAPAIKIDYDALASILAGTLTFIFAFKKSRAAPLLFSFTALSFIFGTKLPPTARSALHPVVVCGGLTALLTQLLRVSAGSSVAERCVTYSTQAGVYYTSLLGPALFALAFKLYGARSMLFSNGKPLAVATVWTSFTALFGTAIVARILRVSPRLASALLPRTTTTPLGIAMAKLLSADESLTVCAIVLSGILGASAGKQILSKLGFKTDGRWNVVRGSAMGASAHGLGTAALAADGEGEASSAAAVMLVLSGALQTILVSIPFLRLALLRIVGAPSLPTASL